MHATHSHSLYQGLPRFSFVQTLLRMAAIARQRHQLRGLDANMLKDLGITREDAEREAKRPAWDVPHFWQR